MRKASGFGTFGIIARAFVLLAFAFAAYAQGDMPTRPANADRDACDSSSQHRTQTMGGWGQNCHGNNVGCIRDTYFPSVFPSGLTIGGAFTLYLSSSSAVKSFMSATPHGTPGVLTANLVDPTSSPAGVFAKQVTALAINIGFGDAGVPTTPPFTNIRGLYLVSGPFAGWTVNDIFALANAVLGGNTGALPEGTTVADLNDAVDMVNNDYVNGTVNLNWLCPVPPCPEPPPMLVAVGDHFCLQFCGRPITVYWCCPFEGQPVFSFLPGCYSGVEGCQVECQPYTGPLTWTAQWDSSNNDCPAPGGWWSAQFTAAGSGCVCVFFDHQLAVELLDFAAVPGSRDVSLRWSTASENGNDYFDVLRDGIIVHREPGAGNSASRTDYAWVDEGLSSGHTYHYVLEAVDLQGNRLRLASQQVTLHTDAESVSEFALEQNYPNPFNPSTLIRFSLAERAEVTLGVYDLMGREVARLIDGERAAGSYSVTFDAHALPAGLYLYRLQAGSSSAVRKLVLVK